MPAILLLILEALKKLWPYILVAMAVGFIFFKVHEIETKLHAYDTQKIEIAQLQNQLTSQSKQIRDIQTSYSDLMTKNNQAETKAITQKQTFNKIITNQTSNDSDKEKQINDNINGVFDNMIGN